MRKLYLVPILFTACLTGCSSGANQASSPANAPSDANANSSASVAQNATPLAPSGQPSVVAPVRPAQPATKPEAKPGATADAKPAANTNAAHPGATLKTAAPKLILPLVNIDFGSVSQGKSLTRNLVVRNTGKADLNIESVVPS